MIAIFVFSIALEETPCSDLVPEVWFYLEPTEHAGSLWGRMIISRPRLSEQHKLAIRRLHAGGPRFEEPF